MDSKPKPFSEYTPNEVYSIRAVAEDTLSFLDQFRGQDMTSGDVMALFAPLNLVLHYCDKLELLNKTPIPEDA